MRTLRKAEKGDAVRLSVVADIAASLELEVGQLLLTERAAGVAVPESSPDVGLTLGTRTFDPERSPPGALLRAEFRQVPFTGRDDEMANLQAWCSADTPIGVQLITGPGGMGKTRLAVELVAEQRNIGWLAGFARAVPRLPSSEARPLLIVIDYAETNSELILDVLGQAMDRGAPTRVLLLARSALEWWQRLLDAGEGIGELLQSRATSRQRLGPVAHTPADRQAAFHAAREAFARTLKVDAPAGEPPDLTAEEYDRILLVQMQALLRVLGDEVADSSTVLSLMLSRERRAWRAFGERRGLPDYLLPVLEVAMATITAKRGVDTRAAWLELAATLPELADQPVALQARVGEVLAGPYPGEQWIEPLLPDLLGEQLGLEVLTTHGDEIFTSLLGPRER